VPIVLVCPNGHKSFVKDEHAGKKAACPICRAVVVVPDPRLTSRPAPAQQPPMAPPPASPPPLGFVRSADDEPVTVAPIAPGGPEEARKKGGRRQALARVNRGLSLHYAKMILYLGNILLFMVFTLLQTFVKPTGRGQAADQATGWNLTVVLVMVFGFLLAASEIVTPLLGMAGSVFCAFVPTKSRARLLIVASVILDFLSLLVMLASLIVPFALHPTEQLGPFPLVTVVTVVLAVIRGLMWFASWVLFMLFLKKLAAYLDQEAAEDEAWRLLLKGLLLAVALPVSGLLMIIPLACCGFAAYFGGFICWFVIAVNYLFEILALIGDLRKATLPVRGS
jgi:hypothetical protein